MYFKILVFNVLQIIMLRIWGAYGTFAITAFNVVKYARKNLSGWKLERFEERMKNKTCPELIAEFVVEYIFAPWSICRCDFFL